MKKLILAGIMVLFTLSFSAPCFADDGISIQIVAGKDKASSSVTVKGQVQHVITDKERASFNIQDSKLKDAVKAYHGKKPNDAYLHSSTPWGDLYKSYNWQQVHTVLKVKSATVTEITSKPTIIATRIFKNNSSKKGTFKASISEKVTDTATSSWSQTSKIEINQKFSYGVTVHGETTLNYTHTWGQSGSETKTSTVGSAEEVKVELEPGESIEAYLTASKGTMRVRIVYEASLAGQVAVNYNPTYKGHHFYGLGINGVMHSANLPTTMEFTEDIEVGYYSNAQVEIKDSKGSLMHKSKALLKH